MMNLNTNGHNTWVVVADSSSCRIYEFSKSPQHMHLVKEISHPENLLKDSDYMSDRQGNYRRGTASGHGTFLANADPKQTKINQFSKEIVSFLEHDRKLQAFQHLILISPPHMNGLIRQQFSKHLKRFLDLSIGKSATHFKQDQLVSFIRQHLALH
jgi:protein required for attachment to host cells